MPRTSRVARGSKIRVEFAFPHRGEYRGMNNWTYPLYPFLLFHTVENIVA